MTYYDSETCHAMHQTCDKYHHVVHLQPCLYHADTSTIEDHACLFQLAHTTQHPQDQKDNLGEQALVQHLPFAKLVWKKGGVFVFASRALSYMLKTCSMAGTRILGAET